MREGGQRDGEKWEREGMMTGERGASLDNAL